MNFHIFIYRKNVFYCFAHRQANEEAYISRVLHFDKTPRVFYISLVFSNARHVLSQCNKRLRLNISSMYNIEKL